MTQQADKLQLCLLTTECPLWQSAWHGWGTTPNPECQTCHGPGRIPLLDPDGKFGLRVKCLGEHILTRQPVILTAPCEQVGCNGWTPTTDLWAYVRAAWQDEHGELEDKIIDAIVDALNNKRNFVRAAFDVVAEVLLI